MTGKKNETTATGTIIVEDPWGGLRRMTAARIALGRVGASLPLRESLAFRLDHARARDAVHAPFARAELAGDLQRAGLDCLELESDVADRGEYLTRPDKGRRLSERSRKILDTAAKGGDICLVVGDGLSARAVQEQAFEFVTRAGSLFLRAGLTLAPVSVVSNARVAIGDEIARCLKARVVVVLIGERPGLSSPNSMGLYLTLDPAPGTTDERRNCISNVRPGGLPLIEGVRKLCYLVEEALRLKTSGVALKDRMATNHLPFGMSLVEG